MKNISNRIFDRTLNFSSLYSNMLDFKNLYLVFIQIDDDIKIVKVDTNDNFYQSEAKVYSVLYNQKLTPEIYIYHLCRIFYPDIEINNISSICIPYSTRLLNKTLQMCTNDGCFLKCEYSSNVDDFITMIKKLSDVDRFFKLSSVIPDSLIQTSENKFENKTPLDNGKNETPSGDEKNKTLLENEKNKIPLGVENNKTLSIEGYSKCKVEYSFINKTNIYLLFNKFNYVGYILTDVESDNNIDYSSNQKNEPDEDCYFRPLACWNRLKSNKFLVQSLFPEIELIDQITDVEMDNLYTSFLNSFLNRLKNPFENKQQFQQFYNNFKQSYLSLKNKTTSNASYPDSVEILSHIKNNYTFNNDIDHRIKFTELLNDIAYDMHVNESHIKFLKSILPQLLKELKLDKKRYSDGMYWYGIVKNCVKTDIPILPNSFSSEVDLNFSNLCKLYPGNCLASNNCDYLETGQINIIPPPFYGKKKRQLDLTKSK